MIDKYTVKIGDWETRVIHSESANHDVPSAIDMLWACANQPKPEYAVANIGDHRTPVGNLDMKGKKPPSEQAVATLTRLNGMSIYDVVYNAINDQYDALKVYGDHPEFVDIVTKAAQEWAKECYQ